MYRGCSQQTARAEPSCPELSCGTGLWSGQPVQPGPHPLPLPASGECPGQKSGPVHPALCSDNLPEGEAVVWKEMVQNEAVAMLKTGPGPVCRAELGT